MPNSTWGGGRHWDGKFLTGAEKKEKKISITTQTSACLGKAATVVFGTVQHIYTAAKITTLLRLLIWQRTDKTRRLRTVHA